MVGVTNNSPVVLFGMHGRTITLGKSLGKGREGSVYVVGDWKAAKVFHPERLSEGRAQIACKVRRLIKYRSALDTKLMHQVMWPLSILRGDDKQFMGYLMPRVMGPRSLNAAVRNMEFDPNHGITDRMDVATQLVGLFDGMHHFGLVIGDVSSNNILVGDGLDGSRKVHLIDVDSVQLPGGVSEMRTPRYLRPRELRGELPVDTCVESDLHALAYLLFELFMRGVSPYAHIGGGSTEENIQKEHFPYKVSQAGKDAPTRFSPYWSEVPKAVREAFVSCFTSSKSLTASEWGDVLRSHKPKPRPFNQLTHLIRIPTRWKTLCKQT